MYCERPWEWQQWPVPGNYSKGIRLHSEKHSAFMARHTVLVWEESRGTGKWFVALSGMLWPERLELVAACSLMQELHTPPQPRLGTWKLLWLRRSQIDHGYSLGVGVSGQCNGLTTPSWQIRTAYDLNKLLPSEFGWKYNDMLTKIGYHNILDCSVCKCDERLSFFSSFPPSACSHISLTSTEYLH